MHYDKNYHLEVHSNLLKNKKYYLFRAELSKKIYWKFLKGKVLEYGCGLGQNIFLNKENSVGVDISEFCLEKCKEKGIKVFDSLGKIKEKFDSVLCVHVLEHLNEPDNIIKEFYNILKSEGILVLVLPDSGKNKIIKKFEPNIGKHLYGWNFNHINELLYANKFNIILNKFNYGGGYSVFYKYPLGRFFVGFCGRLFKRREMIIVARK
ncbi:MAG: class I SAM-dependent methyltransferase [Nanoarchaeota archaeon]|nr:class I SAM-dependent methyltransferase [Nanoarchaeota archaeon]